MNPNSGENHPNIELAPPPEIANSEPNSQERAPVSSPENRPQKQSLQVVSQAANDLALPAQSVAPTSATQADDNTKSTPSSEAKDMDRIEKEWIDKAKSVVERTKSDPYEQKNAMSQVKAEYIKKRFNKSLRTEDSKK